MKTNFTLRKTMQWVVIVVLLAWANGFFAPTPVHADIAPPAAPGLGGLEPFQYQDTQVQMVYERVEITINQDAINSEEAFLMPEQADTVNVSAWFVMRNQGSADEQMQVIFPLKNFDECYGEDATNPVNYRRYGIIPDTFTVRVDGV